MATAHTVQPDGYCPTCRTIGCLDRLQGVRAGRTSTGCDHTEQLNRLELLLRKVARTVGVEIEGDEG